MLRITLHDSSTGFRLRLEGRLAGPWVREVELCWQTAQPVIRNRALIVDLRDVDFVDAAGEELLAVIAAEALAAERPGAKALQLDIMDGRFVPNISFGPDVVAAAKRSTSRRFIFLFEISMAPLFSSGSRTQ